MPRRNWREAASRRGEGPVILVIAEQRDGKLNRAAWEAIAAAQAAGRRHADQDRRARRRMRPTPSPANWRPVASTRCSSVDHPAAGAVYARCVSALAVRSVVESAAAGVRAVAAYLPDARFRADARRADRSQAARLPTSPPFKARWRAGHVHAGRCSRASCPPTCGRRTERRTS